MSKLSDFLTKERLSQKKGSKKYFIQEIIYGIIMSVVCIAGIIYNLIVRDYKLTIIFSVLLILNAIVMIYYYRKITQSKRYLKGKNFKNTYDLFLVDYYSNKMKDKLRNLGIESDIEITEELSNKKIFLELKLNIFSIYASIYPKRIELEVDFDIYYIDKFIEIFEKTNETELSLDYIGENIIEYKTINYNSKENIHGLYEKIAEFMYEKYLFLVNYESKYYELVNSIDKN